MFYISDFYFWSNCRRDEGVPTLPYYFWFFFIDIVTSIMLSEIAMFCTNTVEVDLIVQDARLFLI